MDIAPLKQQTKRKLFTPLNILILLATVTILGVGSYYLLGSNGQDMKNQIQQTHDKIITYADSSSRKDGSTSGSTSSKSSSNNNKPNARSQPASKGVISSNSKLTGAGDGEEPNEDDRDGDNSDKKYSIGSTTEVDSEEDSQEDSEEASYDNEPIVWVDQNAPAGSATPMAGSTRGGEQPWFIRIFIF